MTDQPPQGPYVPQPGNEQGGGVPAYQNAPQWQGQPPSAQSGPGFTQSATPEPPKKKNWFLRHKILSALGVLILIGVVATAANGGKKSDTPAATSPSSNAPAPSQPAKTSDQPKQTSSSAAPAADKQPGLNTPVRDGKFEFTITKIETGKKQIGDEYVNEKAQGEFTLVHLTVKNIGDEAQYLSDSDQKLIDSDGTQYSADSTAAIYIDNNKVLFEQINPGNQVKGVIVFDMPAGKKATKMELHDSAFSGGVTVDLQ